MNQHYRQRPFQAGSPLANVLVVLAGIIVISLSLTLGFFIFLGVTAFLLVTATVFGIRNWWFRRVQGRNAHAASREQPRKEGQRLIIEGEYREVHGSTSDPDKR